MKAKESREAKELLEQRDVLTLRASGWDWPAIAERLEMGEKHCKVLWKRAIGALKAEVDDLALAVFADDLRIYAGLIEAMKGQAASGHPIALEQMRKTMAARRELFKKDPEANPLPKPPAAASGGDDDGAQRVKLNFVRVSEVREDHKPGSEPPAEVARAV